MTEVRIVRDPRLSAVAAGLTALVAAAYFVRAAGTGGVVNWFLCVVLTALVVIHLRALRDARTPLLVADRLGVRIRLGRQWRGAPWTDLDEVEHLPRRGRLRDGRLIVFPADPDVLADGLGRYGRWTLALNSRLYGAPYAVPLGLTTRIDGDVDDLTEALSDLAGARCDVVRIVPGLAAAEDLAEFEAPAAMTSARTGEDEAPEPTVVVRQPLDAALVGQTSVTETLLVADLAEVPIVDPVIGPVLRAARQRLRLGVDQLAERTKIRPHVIEALEIDDFGPCGGDFYARGHVRTLARVLGVDAAPLLEIYDARYANAPLDPLRVFESDLAGRRAREERSRPGTSVLVAAVMATVLVWSVARLLMDTPVTVAPVTPSLADGSAGLANGAAAAPAVDVSLVAAGGGAHVVVRDGAGVVVFKDSIPFGVTQRLRVSPPVRVQSSDGSLEVVVDGVEHGAMGSTGSTAQDVYTAR
jgi:cytoskeleton protein RodZ